MSQQQHIRPQGSMAQQLPSSYQMLPPASFAASGQMPAPSHPAPTSTAFQSSGQPSNYSQLLSSAQQFALPYQGAYQQGLPFMHQGLPGMQIPLGYYPPASPYHLQQMAQSMWVTQQSRQQTLSGAPAANASQAQQQTVPLPSQSLVSLHFTTCSFDLPAQEICSRASRGCHLALQG